MEVGERAPQSRRTTRRDGGRGRGGDLFVCFTSGRKAARLRNSSSTKGAGCGRSPATFGSTAGEPSSPKVSCVGQVRVKTTRRRRKTGAGAVAVRSRSRSGSFRRAEERSRSQSWVHLPLGVVCDALRNIGSEVNCCFRMRRSCCGGMRRRRRKKEVVEVAAGRSGRRRGTGLELVADELLRRELTSQKRKNVDIQEEAPAPCVPPKNALLLMRYGSDPARVSALQSRFRADEVDGGDGEPAEQEEEEEEEEEEETKLVVGGRDEKDREGKVRFWQEEMVKNADLRNGSTSESMDVNGGGGDGENRGEEKKEAEAVAMEEEEEEEKSIAVEEVRRRSTGKDVGRRSISTEKEMRTTSYREGRRSSFSSEGEGRRSSFSSEKEGKRRWSFSSEKESKAMAPTAKKEKNELPECLLLMMYEPKLSMEVSKETWVCTADFLRWQPNRRRLQHSDQEKAKAEVEEEAAMAGAAGGENKVHASDGEDREPDTASVGKSPAPAVEPKNGGGSAGGKMGVTAAVPFVLTRCKSEPTRTAPSSASSDGCFWKSTPQLIGAAAIGL